MEKIKILECFGTMNIGGAETLMINLLSEFDMDRYQIDFLVFTENKGVYDDRIINSGCRIFRLNSLSEVGIFKYIYSIINLIKKNGGYDIVHSHMDWLGAFIVFAAFRAKVCKRIVHSHAVQTIFEDNIYKRGLVFLSKFIIKRYATDYIACSDIAAKSLFINSKKTYILNNAIDLERLTLLSNDEMLILKEKYGISDDMIVLGNIGSLSKNKNQLLIIKALEEINKISDKYVLFLIGNGPEEDNLKKYVKDKCLTNVFFEDKTLDINKYLSLIDLFLFPSFNEGMGMVVLEAQAMGIPCIISKSIPSSVDIGAGLIERCSNYDEKAWSNAILNNKKQKVNLEFSKRLIIKKGYDIRTIANRLKNIYEGNVYEKNKN